MPTPSSAKVRAPVHGEAGGKASAKAKSPRRASLTIRGLDPALKRRLRIRAAQHGRSMEAEARALLACGLASAEPDKHIAERIRDLFAPLGGLDVELPPRGPSRPLPFVDY